MTRRYKAWDALFSTAVSVNAPVSYRFYLEDSQAPGNFIKGAVQTLQQEEHFSWRAVAGPLSKASQIGKENRAWIG